MNAMINLLQPILLQTIHVNRLKKKINKKGPNPIHYWEFAGLYYIYFFI